MIKCQTEVTKEAFVPLIDIVYKTNKRTKLSRVIIFLCALLLIGIGTHYLVVGMFQGRWLSVPYTIFMVVALFLGIFFIWIAVVGLKKLALRAMAKKHSIKNQEVMNYTFDEDTLTVELLGNTGTYQWTAIDKLYEGDRYYIYGINNIFNPIDKKGFEGNGLADFQVLLTRVLKIPIEKI